MTDTKQTEASLLNFNELTREQIIDLIRQMAARGDSEREIATLLELCINYVRACIGGRQ
jgi:uncharacterized protein (DUF433 family)